MVFELNFTEMVEKYAKIAIYLCTPYILYKHFKFTAFTVILKMYIYYISPILIHLNTDSDHNREKHHNSNRTKCFTVNAL